MLLICYVVFVLSSFIIASIIGEIYLIIVLLINLFFLFLLIYNHSSKYKYICPFCNKEYTINFLHDLFSLNGAIKGKYLKCPHCYKKSWVKEIKK